MGQATAGIHEFVFGAPAAERDALLKFWQVLGFEPVDEGKFDASQAGSAYDHAQKLSSVRLRHQGCVTFNTGLVRLQFWESLRNEGLVGSPAIATGSRWMGLYTRDILQLEDSFRSAQAKADWDLSLSPRIHAPLQNPAPEPDFYAPFVGLRELLVFGNRFRLAFIQRGGFDRPGFGTFDEALAYKNTEGSHANIVQPDNAFSTAFYKSAFGFETAPFGDPHDSGAEPPTIAALNLRPNEMFRIERTRAPDCPSGLLQVYSSYMKSTDYRDKSRPGSGNLCAYSIRVRSLDELESLISQTEAAKVQARFQDEFGEQAVSFYAPDGYAWLALSDG